VADVGLVLVGIEAMNQKCNTLILQFHNFSANGTFISVEDRIFASDSAQYGYPVLDESIGGTDDILLKGGSQDGTVTSFYFKKRLTTPDKIGDYPINIFQNVYFIFAYGFNNTFAYHAGRKMLQINLLTGKTQNVDEVWVFLHAGLMFSSFAMCLTFGIFVARYLKKNMNWWFRLHVVVQTLALIMASTGFGIAIWMVGSRHFASLHAYFGYCVFILSILTAIIGFLAHRLFNPGRFKTPIWPDKLHWYFARLVMLGSYVTIFLGLIEIEASFGLVIAFATLLGIYLLSTLFLEITIWVNGSFDISEKTPLIKRR